ncbi:hypothetical protein KUL97_06625 [Synechococcus sp. HK05]|uniref:hypothetical protein n=1 Tax=Synechococcus sp. HK05 TaxID=2725975 RepID=UPI001C381000|nr:hypothetical protein [Synechococcus sp. HK05]MBV2351381.1 hypothetical protein [Synechococcus sp. HK05]
MTTQIFKTQADATSTRPAIFTEELEKALNTIPEGQMKSVTGGNLDESVTKWLKYLKSKKDNPSRSGYHTVFS